MSLAKTIAGFWMRLMGMRIEYPYPLPDKCVIAVVPHTSNWDFPIGLCIRLLLDEKIHFVAKDSLFSWPFGGIFRKLGGVPVDRSKNNNFVQAVAQIFEQRKYFHLTVAPEGTRSKVDKLKSGFYYIAIEAKVSLNSGICSVIGILIDSKALKSSLMSKVLIILKNSLIFAKRT